MHVVGAIGDTSYDMTLLLHILTAIVGFGAVFLNGLSGTRVKQLGGEGRHREAYAVAQANFRTTMVAEYFIYAVPILGIGLVFMSDDVWSFGDTWIWLALVLYVVGLGVSHGLLMRDEKRMHVLMAELVEHPPSPEDGPPPQADELDRRGKRVAASGAFLDVLVVVLLYLMVFKPGA